MDYKLVGLLGEKQWWDFGKIKTNVKGKNVASFELSNLKKLVEQCEKQEEFKGKKYINLYLKDNIPRPAPKQEYKTEPKFDLEDEIPF